MFWMLIIVLILFIPILSIVLDSHLGRVIAARFERREIGPAGDLLVDRMTYLEGEVERLGAEVRRLDEEGRFLQQLLEKRGEQRPALREGERTD
jgi:hypothetical protein